MTIIETDWKWKYGLSKRARTDYIVLHHAEASVCTAQQIDEWHKKGRNWSGIGYHFFVRKNGSVYRGRPLDRLGAHVLEKNNCSIGICAEGAYSREYMPDVQKRAIAELIDYLKTNYYPSAKIVGHKEIGSSDCPGKNYPLEELKDYKNILNESEELNMSQYTELKGEIGELKNSITAVTAKLDKLSEPTMVYDYIDSNMPSWAVEGVRYCLEHGIITGTGDGKLGLDDKDLKFCTMVMRMMNN